MKAKDGWQFWIDVGGTFTDSVGISPNGETITKKILSTSTIRGKLQLSSTISGVLSNIDLPKDFFVGYTIFIETTKQNHKTTVKSYCSESRKITWTEALPSSTRDKINYKIKSPEPSPLFAIRMTLGLKLEAKLKGISLKLATTRATNALLEKKGPKVGLLVTKGFEDLILIGNGSRPELFSLQQPKFQSLATKVFSVDERIMAEKHHSKPPNIGELDQALDKILNNNISNLAISFLNSHLNGQHERLAVKHAINKGFETVCCSSEISSQAGYFNRISSVVTETFLNQPIKSYLESIAKYLDSEKFKVLTSAGTIVPWQNYRCIDALFSGPAGGAVALSMLATKGKQNLISFDMGGTSTDITRYDGIFQRRFVTKFSSKEHSISTTILSPSIAIDTIAAGGGSICKIENGLLLVGPESAGADPGPASYGAGGPLTITDINLYLKRISKENFPFPLLLDRVEVILEAMLKKIDPKERMTKTQLAESFLTIACTSMATAIETNCMKQGHDPRLHHLVSFGGAAGQVACRVADLVGIKIIIIHPLSSIFSAYGVGSAKEALFFEKFWGQVVRQPKNLAVSINSWKSQIQQKLPHLQAIADSDIKLLMDCRYSGQDNFINLEIYISNLLELNTLFIKNYKKRFGYTLDRDLEIGTVRVIFQKKSPVPIGDHEATTEKIEKIEKHQKTLPIIEPTQLPYKGPALLVIENSTVFVEKGWVAKKDKNLVKIEKINTLSQKKEGTNSILDTTLLSNRLKWIAEEMGVQLTNTAISTNIKERQDFSCAIFSSSGELIVNAPHIPVHLGAMGATIQDILKKYKNLRSDCIYLSNHPYKGGSHLNDITVVSAIYDESGNLIGYLANRAHHAEVGGIQPGSMSPQAKWLDEEGIVLEPTEMQISEEKSWLNLEKTFNQGPFPSRSTRENILDIKAQVAANLKGLDLCQSHLPINNVNLIQKGFETIQALAEKAMTSLLQKLPKQPRSGSYLLENGSTLKLSFQFCQNKKQAQLCFAGTSPASNDNFNANPAITRAAIMYSFRLMIDQEIPLNSGLLKPLKILIPEGSILNPKPINGRFPATGAGNVETSQGIVNLILHLFEVAAASQSTMNNLLFGTSDKDRSFGYYETMGGGSGASKTADGDGPSQVHMTNTQLTDPEILESRYPVRLINVAIRQGSGGLGRFNGGPGMVREYEFLANLQVSLITSGRNNGAKGLHGGGNGRPGQNQIFRHKNKKWEKLPAICSFIVGPGDILKIETPGGGGCFTKNSKRLS